MIPTTAYSAFQVAFICLISSFVAVSYTSPVNLTRRQSPDTSNHYCTVLTADIPKPVRGSANDTLMRSRLAWVDRPPPGKIELRPQLWDIGSTIKLAFTDVTCPQNYIDGIKLWSSIWTNFLNIKFKFVDMAESHNVEITCDKKRGSGSTVGKYSNSSMQFMNFGWINKRVVLHEFGHLLGFIHEHQSPKSPINVDCNSDGLKNFAKGQGWSIEDACANLKKEISPTTDATVFDPDSIMLYGLSSSLTGLPHDLNTNTDLSSQDIAAAAALYPFNACKTDDCSVCNEGYVSIVAENKLRSCTKDQVVKGDGFHLLGFVHKNRVMCVYTAATFDSDLNRIGEHLFAMDCTRLASFSDSAYVKEHKQFELGFETTKLNTLAGGRIRGNPYFIFDYVEDGRSVNARKKYAVLSEVSKEFNSDLFFKNGQIIGYAFDAFVDDKMTLAEICMSYDDNLHKLYLGWDKSTCVTSFQLLQGA